MTNQVRTIRLYGVLGREFGRVHRMAVSSAAESVSALISQYPRIERFLNESKDKGIAYAVFYGRRNIGKDQLCDPCGNDDIRIAPILIGSKQGGFFQIVLGAILVVVGVLLAPLGIGTLLVNLGVSMILGGITQLLVPAPKGRSSRDRPENEPSYAFNGPVNTQAQGNCVPVLYGRMIIGSATASAGIEAKDHSIVPDNSTVPSGGNSSAGGGTPRLIQDLLGL